MRPSKNFSVAISSVLYVGFLPFIPGTFGSIAGLGLYFLIKDNPFLYLAVTLLVTFLGLLYSGKAEAVLGKKDPSCVVIDEVCGMLLSLAFIPHDIKFIVAGFFLFRLLDTLKPYPASSLQRLKGSTGIMVDDIIAGLYVNIVLQLVVRFASFKTS